MASLRLLGGGGDLGRAGELDPRLTAAYGVRAERVAFATIDLAVLQSAIPPVRRSTALPKVPAVERDLAIVVADGVAAGEVEAIAREAAGPILTTLHLFDRYRGAPLAAGETSLAYRLRLQGGETLTDAEVDTVLARIVEALRQRLGARPRA